jgi:DNA polymerase-3 subunit alpha (Gram-positive type)
MKLNSHKTDNAPVKRVELCTRTIMNSYNNVPTEELVDHVSQWGHNAIAITNKDVVHTIPEAYEVGKRKGIKIIFGATINLIPDSKPLSEDHAFYSSATLLAKNRAGLKNLYRIISLAYTEHFHTSMPFVPQSVLDKHRDGLLVGAAAFDGGVYAGLNIRLTQDEILSFAEYYDYLEVAPFESDTDNIAVTKIGEKLKIPVVAVGVVHYIDDFGKKTHRMLQVHQDYGGGYTKRHSKLHFLTTEEMLEEFAFLGEDKAYEVVVKNTNLLADMIEEFPPIPEGLFLPKLDSAEDEIVKICNSRFEQLYGKTASVGARERLEYELGSIIESGYASIYMAAHKMVKKSNESGYIVGTRGSAGSSFVAYLLGIAEIDPIKYNIPFETFAGLNGKTVPDFDFNVCEEYASNTENYVGELFGKNKVFRGGVTRTPSYSHVKKIVTEYFSKKESSRESIGIKVIVRTIKNRIKTIEPHPASLVIVPNYKDIYDFTPIQYSTSGKGGLYTHFDGLLLGDTLLKLDLVAHEDITKLNKLAVISGIDINSIPLDDEKTLSLFNNADTHGVPVFDKDFTRHMLQVLTPRSFDDLIKISGLAHGTGAWDSAERVIVSGKATLSEVISSRDDIMVYLMEMGADREVSYEIMEDIRKGRGIAEKNAEIMVNLGVPEWYTKSCREIAYLFPKAHAVAYALMAYQTAWFKVHKPDEFEEVFQLFSATHH